EGIGPDGRWPLLLAGALRAGAVALDDPLIVATTGWTTDEPDAAIDAAPPGGVFGLVSLVIGVNYQHRGRDVAQDRDQFGGLRARAAGLAGGGAGRVLVRSIPDWGVAPFARQSGRARAQIARELDAYNAAARE